MRLGILKPPHHPTTLPIMPLTPEERADLDPSPFDDLPTPLVVPVPTMLDSFQTVNILAPLVRCSKLPFRHLCSLYETQVTTTPMMLAEEFSRSQIARTSDFTTSKEERGVFWMEPRHAGLNRETIHPEDRVSKTDHCPRPHSRLPPTAAPPTKQSVLVRGALLAQFASPNGKSLADAAELISPSIDGLDLNCGCPQRWAYNEGIGCALLRKPELVRDMVRTVQDRMGWNWPVSVKIRVDPDLKWVAVFLISFCPAVPFRTAASSPASMFKRHTNILLLVVLCKHHTPLTNRLTDTLVKSALSAGVSHITIHGRTRHQASTEPVDLDAIKFAVECAGGQVPCVANGDLWDLSDAAKMRETGVKGVMGARGLLAK